MPKVWNFDELSLFVEAFGHNFAFSPVFRLENLRYSVFVITMHSLPLRWNDIFSSHCSQIKQEVNNEAFRLWVLEKCLAMKSFAFSSECSSLVLEARDLLAVTANGVNKEN